MPSQSRAKRRAANSTAFQTVIDAPWTKLEPVRVGAISSGFGTPDIYVLVEDDGSPLVRIDVYADEADHTFQDVLVWEGFVVIGFGHVVHLVGYRNSEAVTLRLDNYFARLYPGAGWLIVASSERLFRINPDGRIAWKTETLGLDGVVVDATDDNVVLGQEEWDPPGGWRPFQVSLKSGETLLES